VNHCSLAATGFIFTLTSPYCQHNLMTRSQAYRVLKPTCKSLVGSHSANFAILWKNLIFKVLQFQNKNAYLLFKGWEIIFNIHLCTLENENKTGVFGKYGGTYIVNLCYKGTEQSTANPTLHVSPHLGVLLT